MAELFSCMLEHLFFDQGGVLAGGDFSGPAILEIGEGVEPFGVEHIRGDNRF